jgi:hypothetical protein
LGWLFFYPGLCSVTNSAKGMPLAFENRRSEAMVGFFDWKNESQLVGRLESGRTVAFSQRRIGRNQTPCMKNTTSAIHAQRSKREVAMTAQ